VQQGGQAAAAGSRFLADQVHRLRLRQIRLLGRAQAPPGQVGQRGEEPATLAAAASSAMNKPVAFWLALGGIGFAVLPWYLGDGFDAFDPAQSGLVLGVAGKRPWLLPLGAALRVGLGPLLSWRARPVANGAWLTAGAVSGPVRPA